MATIHIKFDKAITFEQHNNILIFKKDEFVVREYSVDQDYNIVTLNDSKEHNKLVIYPKKIKKTRYIPNGYSNLRLSLKDGYYHVTDLRRIQDEEVHQYMNDWKYHKDFQRDFIYFDTSSIDKREYSCFLQKYGYENYEIPDSFWFFNRWRDFWGWCNIEEAIEKSKKFDMENNTTLITKSEALCIMYEQLYLRQQMINCMPVDKYPYTNPVYVEAHSIYLENWDIPVIDSNEMYYRMCWTDDKFYDEPLNLYNQKREALFAIPVIHKPKCMIKK